MIFRALTVFLLAACALILSCAIVQGDQLKNLASADSGAVFFAEPTAPDNGSLAYINDGYASSYWYAGDHNVNSSVLVLLRSPSTIHSVRFLSWATGRHTPRDYQVVAIDSRSGESHVIADVKGDTTLGPKWVDITPDAPVLADQVVLKVTDVQEHEHGAVIYEFEVLGEPAKQGAKTPKLDPKKTYLLVSAGRSLASKSSKPVTLKLWAGLPGKEQLAATKTCDIAGLFQFAVDISKWEGKTIDLVFEAEGEGPEDAGVWLDPKIVKGKDTVADLIGYWSAYHEGSLNGAVVGGPSGSKTILCPLASGKSKLTITVPVSAELIIHKAEARQELERRRYGASDERLQSRSSASQQIDLKGIWQMSGRDPDSTRPFGTAKPQALPDMKGWEWYDVPVPGSVRSGLLDAKVIEDPYWSDNAGKSPWTEKKDWWFRKSVAIPESWAGRRICIGFDGIDYYSSIWVDGKFLGDHEGMYGGPVADITSVVRFGKPNEIVVQVRTGGTDEPGKVYKGFIFMKWHYQTDISPRGIWRGARIVATGPVRLENPCVRTLSADQNEAVLEIALDVDNPSDAEHVVLNGTVAGDNFKSSGLKFSIPAKLVQGKQTVRYRLPVPKPKLWWPAGMGAPNLYKLKLQASADGHVSDAISMTFGIRTLECDPNPNLDSDVNNRFLYKINGKLISMRGAGGFGANDQIYRDYARKDAWFIKVAEHLNFNFIRVHGAGVIANDGFYDLCDRMGMMVWQEFMVSNMSLSGVHQDVWRAQTVQSILRLRNHPSLIRWCGGNEFNPDSTGDENKTIIDMFEECVAKYDGTRLFSRAAQYVNDPHYSDESGAYGGFRIAACTEYGGAFDGSIVSERALNKFLPAEDVTSWPPVTKEPLQPSLPKDTLAKWDNTRRGPFVFHTALTGRCEGWGWPGDLTALLPLWSFVGTPHTMNEAFDISQVFGGCTTGYIIENLRSRWPNPSLYASWDYAPIWPMSVVWGPIDYYGGVLPCAYYYKRAQEPLHVLVQMESKAYVKTPIVPVNAFAKIYQPGDQFKGRVYVVSDLDHSIGEHTAELVVYDAVLKPIHTETMKMAAMEKGPSSLLLGTLTWDVPKTMPNQTALVCVSLKNASGKVVSRSAYPIWISSDFDALMKDPITRRDRGPWLTGMKSAQTKLAIKPISKSVSFAGKDYLPAGKQGCAEVVLEITNTGDKPAFHTGVEITNVDCRYFCDDNYFVLMPGEAKKIVVEIDRSTQPFYECVRKQLVQPVGSDLQFTATAWNAPKEIATLAVK